MNPRGRQRARVRDHYRRNKPYYLAKNNRRRQALRDWLREYKESHPCVDCGRLYPACVMDFDHLGDKRANVSTLVSRGSVKRLEEEIGKCDLVCANDHRLRTQRRIAEVLGEGAKSVQNENGPGGPSS